MKKTTFVLLIILGLVAVIPTAFAAEFMAAGKDGNISIGSSETHKNLYIAGANVSVNSNTEGDLFAAGGGVNLGGSVSGDLFAASGNVNVNGNVAGDARVAGGSISLNSPIGGDLLVAGGNVAIAEKAAIGGDLIAGAGNLSLDAPVAGYAKIAGGVITINSKIDGSVTVRADEKLIFGPQAQVAGKITYYGPVEAVVQEGAQVGAIDFQPVSKKKYASAGVFGAALLVKLLALLVAALLVLKFLRRTSETVTTHPMARPWQSLGIGFLGLVAFPIAILLLFVTIIGYYVALILLFWYILALTLSSVFMIILLGRLVDKWILKNQERLSWHTVVWGIIAGGIISIIPVVGWLVTFVLFLMSFGSVLRTIKHRLDTVG